MRKVTERSFVTYWTVLNETLLTKPMIYVWI